jgi:hypothetical protein
MQRTTTVRRWLEALTQFATQWGWWLAAVSAIAFVATLAWVPVIVARLPEDFLTREHRPPPWQDHPPLLRWLLLIAKNALGATLLLGGIIMLVTPGQGVLSIVTGLLLIDFPGKRAVERLLLGHPRVLRAINALRQRWRRPPLDPPRKPRQRR